MEPVLFTLLWAFVIVCIVVGACMIIDKTIPAEFQMLAKFFVGVVGLVAIIYLILPVMRIHG